MSISPHIHKPLIPWPESDFPELPEVRRLALYGSTGSIGTSTLDIVRSSPQNFKVTALFAGSNVGLLAEQCREFRPEVIGIADSTKIPELRKKLGECASEVEILGDDDSITAYASEGTYDIQVAAIVGFSGLASVYNALCSGRVVALANKESIVAAGHILKEVLQEREACGTILPLDSEHSALFQALRGYSRDDVQSLILTASGGPFLYTTTEQMANICPEQALKHPRWSMGRKISIDSATMMNKAFELIETYWLFGFSEQNIEVLIHPQSIVHSQVQFRDGACLAQLSPPDMRVQIAFGINFPRTRISANFPTLDYTQPYTLEFLPLDNEKFEAVSLARECLRSGGNASLVLNLANDIAVQAFLDEKLRFQQIVPFAKEALSRHYHSQALNFNDTLEFKEHLSAELESKLVCP